MDKNFRDTLGILPDERLTEERVAIGYREALRDIQSKKAQGISTTGLLIQTIRAYIELQTEVAYRTPLQDINRQYADQKVRVS